MLPREKFPRFCVQDTLLAGDATRTLLAGATNRIICVTRYVLTGIVAAAQTVYLGDTSGTVKVISLPVSAPGAGLQVFGYVEEGLALTVSQDLIIKPAAAGPSMHCLVEGYIKNLGAF